MHVCASVALSTAARTRRQRIPPRARPRRARQDRQAVGTQPDQRRGQQPQQRQLVARVGERAEIGAEVAAPAGGPSSRGRRWRASRAPAPRARARRPPCRSPRAAGPRRRRGRHALVAHELARSRAPRREPRRGAWPRLRAATPAAPAVHASTSARRRSAAARRAAPSGRRAASRAGDERRRSAAPCSGPNAALSTSRSPGGCGSSSPARRPRRALGQRGALRAEDPHVGVPEAVDRLQLVADDEASVAASSSSSSAAAALVSWNSSTITRSKRSA